MGTQSGARAAREGSVIMLLTLIMAAVAESEADKLRAEVEAERVSAAAKAALAAEAANKKAEEEKSLAEAKAAEAAAAAEKVASLPVATSVEVVEVVSEE